MRLRAPRGPNPRAAYVLALLLAVGCGPSAGGSPSAAGQGESGAPGGVLARLDGEPITVQDFETFVARARPPGHRIASLQEAFRLLRGLAERRLLERLGGGSDGPGEEGWELRAREALVEARFGPVTVAPADVDRFLARHETLFRTRTVSDAERERVARRLHRRRVEERSHGLLARRLQASLRTVDFDALRRLVQGRPADATGPPRPPGFAARGPG